MIPIGASEVIKKISTIDSIEQMLSLYSILPDKLIKNCMLFLMREGIDPMWEHPDNRDGGCFSYKVGNKSVAQVWKNLSYILVGETLTNNHKMEKLLMVLQFLQKVILYCKSMA